MHGNVIISYTHCQCAGTRDGRRGHRTYDCLTCSELVYVGHHFPQDSRPHEYLAGFTYVPAKP
ncbi:hypothetical protein GCM10023199_13730 [Actinomycetospora chibensis]